MKRFGKMFAVLASVFVGSASAVLASTNITALAAAGEAQVEGLGAIITPILVICLTLAGLWVVFKLMKRGMNKA